MKYDTLLGLVVGSLTVVLLDIMWGYRPKTLGSFAVVAGFLLGWLLTYLGDKVLQGRHKRGTP